MKRYDLDSFDQFVEREDGSMVCWTDVQSIQAERDRLREALDIGKEAESLFVELTSDGRLDIRTEAAMELCEVFQRFQDARRALEGEKG